MTTELEKTEFDDLPPAVQLEQAIAFMERRAANSHILAKAERGENSRYVKAHHMMSAVSIDLILPHARAALDAMKATPAPIKGQSSESWFRTSNAIEAAAAKQGIFVPDALLDVIRVTLEGGD